ncbi:MAG TPA: ISAs1 family transposase [Pyrinomonadaceae bacterium]|nr:ISAs1 family transposase [Pyrinomonadaceae bacterium]
MQPCPEDNRSFFEKLQNEKGLDLRDNRGKRHDLATILMGVVLALLSNRDGNLSSIQRHLKNHYERLVEVLGVEKKRPVSRSQLPIILAQVSVVEFNRLLFANYGIELSEAEQKWFALDGKELRGSIETGNKRGEAIVQAVAHDNLQVVAQDYYAGEKESEVPIVRKLLEEHDLAAQKTSLDALHCKPKTLEIITQAGGKYVVGLKENQKELKKQITQAIENQSYLLKIGTQEKGHGRIETRIYQFYDVLELATDERWRDCQIKTAIKVKRERIEIKTNKISVEDSFYLTNEVGKYEELAQAVRLHWTVETNNQIRDVSLQEDKMRSKKRIYSKQWVV